MPGAAVVGAALNSGVIRPYGLFVGGLDVRPNVPLNYAITVVEAGPGEVSSIGFTIEDPDGTIAIPNGGTEIRLQDLVLDYPIFSGYLSTCQVEPYPAVGKLMTIDGTGLEALIDWWKLPATDLGGSDISPRNVLEVFAWLAYQNPQANLVAPQPVFGTDPLDGDATHPIGTLNNGLNLKVWATGGPYVTPLGSLRAALLYAGRVAWGGSFLLQTATADPVVTVDFYRRLRIFRRGQKPGDYTDLTVTDTAAGTYVASNLQWIVAPGEVVRAVYVQGTGIGAWITDGTGIIGPQETISDPSATSLGRLTQAGRNYLASQAALVRGTLTLEDYVPTVGTIHPGSSLIITDANVGLAAASYQIFRITKTFRAAGRQDWRIDFGGSRPTYVQRVQKTYGKALAWSTNE